MVGSDCRVTINALDGTSILGSLPAVALGPSDLRELPADHGERASPGEVIDRLRSTIKTVKKGTILKGQDTPTHC